MNFLRTLLSRAASLFNRHGQDADFDDELRAHIDLLTNEYMQKGVPSAEASRLALAHLGGLTQTREAWRLQRSVPALRVSRRRLRYALRQFRRAPGFTLTIVLTLAAGIAGNTVIFSIVNGVLLNPLPFAQPEQLVSLHESKPNFQYGSISYPNFLDWRSQNKTFASMALSRSWSFSMTGRGDAEQLRGQFLSSGFFALLGVNPLLGREFSALEEQRARRTRCHPQRRSLAQKI